MAMGLELWMGLMRPLSKRDNKKSGDNRKDETMIGICASRERTRPDEVELGKQDGV